MSLLFLLSLSLSLSLFPLDDYLETDTDHTIIIDHCQEVIESSTLTDVHVVTLIWKSVMDAGDWRDDQIVDQLEKHLEVRGRQSLRLHCGFILFYFTEILSTF